MEPEIVSLGHRNPQGFDWQPDTERLFSTGRLRTVRVGPDVALYVLTSNRDGRGSPAESDDRVLRLTAP